MNNFYIDFAEHGIHVGESTLSTNMTVISFVLTIMFASQLVAFSVDRIWWVRMRAIPFRVLLWTLVTLSTLSAGIQLLPILVAPSTPPAGGLPKIASVLDKAHVEADPERFWTDLQQAANGRTDHVDVSIRSTDDKQEYRCEMSVDSTTDHARRTIEGVRVTDCIKKE